MTYNELTLKLSRLIAVKYPNIHDKECAKSFEINCTHNTFRFEVDEYDIETLSDKKFQNCINNSEISFELPNIFEMEVGDELLKVIHLACKQVGLEFDLEELKNGE